MSTCSPDSQLGLDATSASHTVMATVDGISLVAESRSIDEWQTVSLFATTDETVASTSVCMHAVYATCAENSLLC